MSFFTKHAAAGVLETARAWGRKQQNWGWGKVALGTGAFEPHTFQMFKTVSSNCVDTKGIKFWKPSKQTKTLVSWQKSYHHSGPLLHLYLTSGHSTLHGKHSAIFAPLYMAGVLALLQWLGGRKFQHMKQVSLCCKTWQKAKSSKMFWQLFVALVSSCLHVLCMSNSLELKSFKRFNLKKQLYVTKQARNCVLRGAQQNKVRTKTTRAGFFQNPSSIFASHVPTEKNALKSVRKDSTRKKSDLHSSLVSAKLLCLTFSQRPPTPVLPFRSNSHFQSFRSQFWLESHASSCVFAKGLEAKKANRKRRVDGFCGEHQVHAQRLWFLLQSVSMVVL